MKKKMVSMLLSVVMVTSLAAGMVVGAAEEKEALTIAIWGDEERAASYMETLAPFCEENNCEITIEVVPIAEYFDKLATQLPAGTAPDVFWLADGKEGTFIDGEWVANMKDALVDDEEYNLGDFYEDAIYSTDYDGDGDIYGIPFSFGARAIFYNQTLFEEAGLESPADCVANGTWTYEKMFELAAAIEEYDSSKIGTKLWCVGNEKNSVQAFADILSAYGANLMNADSTEFLLDQEEGIAVTQMVYDAMYTNGGHAPGGDVTNFVSGNVAMARETYSYMKTMVNGNVDFEWGVVPQPYGSLGADGTMYTGYAYWCANDTSENVDLAIELVKYITNSENLIEWSNVFMSPRRTVMESETIINPGEGYPSSESIKAAFVDVIEERGLFTYRGTPNFTLLQDTVQQNYEMIWAGAYNVEDGVVAMKAAVEPYLN